MDERRPTTEEADQCALMLSLGCPARDALAYFVGAEAVTPTLQLVWTHDRNVQRATLRWQGKRWEEMTLEERVRFAIDKHYGELAYFIYSTNYNDLSGADKLKADTCRTALEAKLAGFAGKTDALSQFFDDLKAGRVALTPAADRVQ